MSGWAIEFQSTLPAWGRHCFTPQIPSTSGFQSTLPVWGATCMSWTRCTTQAYFNPHSPYGERPRRPSRTVRMRYFNPRSPRGERRADGAKASVGFQFQSTLPVWGATAKMHRFFFCIFGKKGIFCDILQIGRHLQGIGRKRRGDFLSRSVRTSRGKYGYLAFAFRESGGLRENRRFYSQSVLFSFRIDCQGSRIAGCPFRGP